MGAGELFDDPAMAAGYASDRPAVHPFLVERLRATPAWPGTVRMAVDVGCGAGASTAALLGLAERTLGLDPFVPMVAAAYRAVPDAAFAVARAEALPCATRSVDLLAAAGALNFARIDAFVPEADRVLTDAGVLAVADFGFGRPRDPDTGWPARFATRWPRLPAGRVDASSFAGTAFRVVADERFTVSLPMTRAAYMAYVLTDTAVARARAGGTSRAQVRTWCDDTLPAFGGEQPVTFDATLIVLAR